MDQAGLLYAKTHEWVAIADGVATVGITDFAVKQLTDLVYVELPTIGESFAAGQTFGEVESVKAASDLYAPVAGEIIEVNQGVSDDPAVLSEDAFGAGWLIRLRVSDAAPEGLMNWEDYRKLCDLEEN